MTAPHTLVLTFEYEIPGGWLRLPLDPRESAVAISAIAEAQTQPGEARDQLVRALTAVTELAQSPRRGGRSHWALVPDPAAGRVEGLMSIGDIPGERDDYDRYLELARVDLDAPLDPSSVNPADLINRTVDERRVEVGRMVVIHDFVIQPTPGGVGDPAVERAIVALFPDRAARAIECSIVTQNLAQFEDVTAYLVDIVSSFRETRVTAS